MSATGAACGHCDNPLDAGQRWCHECGAATGLLHRVPDWRVGAAIVAGIVALAAAATVLALTRVSRSADRSAAAASSASIAPASRPVASQAPASPGKLLSWPAGLGGWTVVIASSTNESQARSTAGDLAGKVSALGLLDSSQHPSMTPGRWVVFSGRYPTAAEARAAAANLVAQGHPGAHARMVEPPGGN